MTTYSIALVSIYKDHITYYHLPSEPVLNHGTLSSLQQLEPKKLVLIGSSHTYRLSALVPASLETEYLKLSSQSQTNVEQRIEQFAVSIASFELSPGDFVYIDALSNFPRCHNLRPHGEFCDLRDWPGGPAQLGWGLYLAGCRPCPSN